MPEKWDSHQHHFEERAVFAGCGVGAVGTKELPVGGRRWRRLTLDCVARSVEWRRLCYGFLQ